jgi:acetyl/propionyl-CoA carboxylase alpha subunit
VWAESRASAINRLARVLDEYTIEGISTTIPFFRAIVRDEDFRRGNFDTGFIDRFLSDESIANRRDGGQRETLLADLAAIAAVLHTRANAASPESNTRQSSESRWKLYGRLAQRK